MKNPRTHRPLRRSLLSAAIAATCAAASGPAIAQAVATVTAAENRSPPGTRAHCTGARCYVAKGHTLLTRIDGAGAASATHVVDDSGSISPSLTGWKAQPNRIELQIPASATGSRGEKTVTPQLRIGNNIATTWPFKVTVINNGTIGSASFPTPSDFFTQAEITVNGQNLGNARLFIPNDVSPRPTLSIVSNTDTQVRFRATYSQLQSAPNLKVVLCDEAVSDFGCPPAWGTVTGQIKGPAAVQAMTFSSPANVGSVLTINFQLSTAAGSGGQKVWWKLSNAGDFQAVSGSCPYTPSGNKNEFTVPAGNQTHSCQVKIVQAGGIGAVSRTAEAWVVNPNKLEAPWYKAQQFSISQF